jgi:hypothetical protein
MNIKLIFPKYLARPEAPTLWINVPAGIEQGTSGSPIVTAAGALVGVVSHGGGEGAFYGRAPRPHLTLLVWVLRQIMAGARASL